MLQVFLTFIADLILIEDLFSFPWNYGITYGHILRPLSFTNEQRTNFEVIFGLDVDATSSWWRPQPTRGVWFPSSLVLSHFSKFSHLVILLQVNPVFGDELKTICEGYEI